MLFDRKIKGKVVPFSELYDFTIQQAPQHREYEMQKDLHDYFWRAFSLLRMNKVEGDYCEFGCGSKVRSFRFAWKFSNLEKYGDRKLYAFDTFAGLPTPEGIDEHEQWAEGTMSVTLRQFKIIMSYYRAKLGRDFEAVEGDYRESLVGKMPTDHGIKKIAFAHIDCDLYESTVPVLDYIAPSLANGAILSFDDWFCFNGDPRLGEQRALREWSEDGAGQEFILTQYQPFGWHGQSFIVNRK